MSKDGESIKVGVHPNFRLIRSFAFLWPAAQNLSAMRTTRFEPPGPVWVRSFLVIVEAVCGINLGTFLISAIPLPLPGRVLAEIGGFRLGDLC